MDRRLGFALVALGWLSLCTYAEAQRRGHLSDDPVLRAGLEAGLAAQFCGGVRTDIEGFRAFERSAGLTHADFYTRPRAPSLDADITALRSALRHDSTEPCARLWADYGPHGARAHLLQGG